MFQALTVILLVLKQKKPKLYLNYIQGRSNPSEVLNYIHQNIDANNYHNLEYIEVLVYMTKWNEYEERDIIREQLILLANGDSLSAPDQLSDKIKSMDKDFAESTLKRYEAILGSHDHNPFSSKQILSFVSKRIELIQQIPNQ